MIILKTKNNKNNNFILNYYKKKTNFIKIKNV